MFIRTNASANRKELVKAISELLNEKPKYCFAPTFAYEFTACTIDKDAVIHITAEVAQQSVSNLAEFLNRRGFACRVEGSDTNAALEPEEAPKSPPRIAVYVPHDKISEETLNKLEQITLSKATLLRKALGADSLAILNTAKGYAFPWFPPSSDDASRKAYKMLIRQLILFANQRTRVTATDEPTDNPKYAFRCFLLRLGFIGAEYKTERAILLRNLEGNGAFKSGSAQHKNPA